MKDATKFYNEKSSAKSVIRLKRFQIVFAQNASIVVQKTKNGDRREIFEKKLGSILRGKNVTLIFLGIETHCSKTPLRLGLPAR